MSDIVSADNRLVERARQGLLWGSCNALLFCWFMRKREIQMDSQKNDGVLELA
jgi:hypothetical protein